jgi:hypothetical protein
MNTHLIAHPAKGTKEYPVPNAMEQELKMNKQRNLCLCYFIFFKN